MTAVSLIQCFLMALVTAFFVLMDGSLSFTKWISAAFLMAIFCMMTFSEQKKHGSGMKFRRIFMAVYAVFFCIFFVTNLLDERGSVAITNEAMANAELPFCHIAIPQSIIPFLTIKELIFPARITGHFAAASSMLVIWFIMTLTIGRGWCGWVCFYGGWEDGISGLPKKRRINLVSRNPEIREFQFGFFAFIVLASLGTLSAVYCEWFCPFKLVTEYSPMDTALGVIMGIIFIGLFIALVVVMPFLTKRRTQCSTLCPFGAFASLTDRISPFTMRIDTAKCRKCMKCASSCLFGAIDVKTILEEKGKPEITCAKCGECVAVCPENAISYDFRFAKKCGRPVPKTKAGKVIQAFLNPAVLFRFSAFSFAVIMGGSTIAKGLDALVFLASKIF